ncbi:RNA-binding protein [Chromatiales bacterium (ex Bugula neritina AB1)]|nr:RNA-binding protein [Chromatiales bacterium (ex Bugula neritina AB1)]
MTPNKIQLRFLKTRCHALDPVVRIGQKGVTEALMSELEIALAHHELIKIKVGIGDRDERQAAIRQIAENSNANIIQQIGQIAVLFRRNHEKPVIVFPK